MIVPAAAEAEAEATEVVLTVDEETEVADEDVEETEVVVGRALEDEAGLIVDDFETAAAGAEKTCIAKLRIETKMDRQVGSVHELGSEERGRKGGD